MNISLGGGGQGNDRKHETSTSRTVQNSKKDNFIKVHSLNIMELDAILGIQSNTDHKKQILI